MTEEIHLEMSWTRAVPLLLEVYTNAETPKARADARDELMRCARIADQAVARSKSLELEETVGYLDDNETIQWALCAPGGGDIIAEFSTHLPPEEQERIAKTIVAAFPTRTVVSEQPSTERAPA